MKIFFVALIFIWNIFGENNRTKFSVEPISLFVFNIQNFEFERSFIGGTLGVSFYYGQTGASVRTFNSNGPVVVASEQSVVIKKYFTDVRSSSFWLGGKLALVSSNITTNNGYATNLGTFSTNLITGYSMPMRHFFIEPFGSTGYALTNNFFGDANYVGNVSETKIVYGYGIRVGIIY